LCAIDVIDEAKACTFRSDFDDLATRTQLDDTLVVSDAGIKDTLDH
jgi:hypothetical protein